MHTTERLQAIIDNNANNITLGGSGGFSQMAEYQGSPEFYKNKAAGLLIYVRENREACKAMGRNWRGADANWLSKIADCRRAAFLSTQFKNDDLEAQGEAA